MRVRAPLRLPGVLLIGLPEVVFRMDGFGGCRQRDKGHQNKQKARHNSLFSDLVAHQMPLTFQIRGLRFAGS